VICIPKSEHTGNALFIAQPASLRHLSKVLIFI